MIITNVSLDPINPLNPPILLGEGEERCGLWQDEYIKLHKGGARNIRVHGIFRGHKFHSICG